MIKINRHDFERSLFLTRGCEYKLLSKDEELDEKEYYVFDHNIPCTTKHKEMKFQPYLLLNSCVSSMTENNTKKKLNHVNKLAKENFNQSIKVKKMKRNGFDYKVIEFNNNKILYLDESCFKCNNRNLTNDKFIKYSKTIFFNSSDSEIIEVLNKCLS